MVRIPKRVGAVKLPKKVRKRAKKAIKAAASPLVRDFAAAAMAAAGRIRRADRSAGDREQEGREYRMCTETRIDVDGSKVAEAFRTAAIDGFRRFLEGFEEGLRNAQAERAAAKDDPQPEPQAQSEPEAAAEPAATARPKAKPRKPRASRPGPAPA